MAKQVAAAQYKIRQTKGILPGMFRGYNRLAIAEQALKAAQVEYKAAKLEWDQLGN